MKFIAYIAGLLTLIGYLPQTLKTIRTQETKDLSLATFSIIGSAAVLWMLYGIQQHEPAIWITNAVVSLCNLIIAVIKLRKG